LISATTVKAQSVNDIPLDSIDSEYMEIVGYSRSLFTKGVSINLDFGQSNKIFDAFRGKDNFLKDSTGSSIEFNSMIDALNFFSSNGYDFVTAYTLNLSNQQVYHYLLRRKDK
jgi:hypothetical protein